MILLDTHIFVWLASDPERLTPKVWKALEAHSDSLLVSVVTSWEVALLEKRGRLVLPVPAGEYLDRALVRHGIEELPLGREAVMRAVGLPDVHADPFDRILIAEAQMRGIALVTADRTIARYPGLVVIGAD